MASDKQDKPQFYLYDYDSDWGAVGEANKLIEEGILPADTLFRLAGVGQIVDASTRSTYLNCTMIHEIVRCVDDPDQMRPETREVLFGEIPDAIVDLNSRDNQPFYQAFGTPYYRMADLVQTVHSRRLAWGQSLPDERLKGWDGKLRIRVPDDEWSRCKAIARPVWRLIVERFHPEWLMKPSDYFPARYIGPFCVVYEIGEKSQKKGIVTHAVFSDELVLSIYQEAVSTRVKGLGPVGTEDLRLLLAEEHPELMDGHELSSSS